jgi:hypothetical protein
MSLSVYPVFHRIVKTVTLEHIVVRMTLDHVVERISLHTTVAFDTIIAFVIPLVALLTSPLIMWREEHRPQ